MKNAKKMTFQESGITIKPYNSFPTEETRCEKHEYEQRHDASGHTWQQCKKCSVLK